MAQATRLLKEIFHYEDTVTFTVPPELAEDAQLAVDNCPEEAISTIESASVP